MIRILIAAFATILTVAPAGAYPKLESRMIKATADALMKSTFRNDADGARAGCEAAKSLLTAKTPKYLAAYSEICFALASPSDGNGQKRMCPNYLRAIETWRANPPPIDDEDTALQRAGSFHSWKSFAAENCGAPLASIRTDMGPVASIMPGSRLKTQEGLSYIVPDGWTIKSFDETEGFAMLNHAGRQLALRVARISLNDKMDYSDKTAMAGERTLEWKYIEFFPKSGSYVMYGRTKLNGGAIELGIVTSKDAPSGASVDKDFALETFMAIASSAKIEGKRACIGNCGPGKLVGPEKIP